MVIKVTKARAEPFKSAKAKNSLRRMYSNKNENHQRNQKPNTNKKQTINLAFTDLCKIN
jgi:hypothetical protein